MKKKEFIFISAGLLIFILLLEGFVRIYNFIRSSTSSVILSKNEILVYENRPSIVFKSNHGVRMQYNSLGFIGDEIAPKSNGAFRILGIGDSITSASYLSDEYRFLNILQKILSNKLNKSIEVINAGTGGYNTWQELELIKQKGLSVEPDLIIVEICLNDYIHNKPNLRKNWFNIISVNYRESSEARYFNFLYQKSDLYKFLYDFLAKFRLNTLDKKDFLAYVKNYNFNINENEFREWIKPLSEINTVAKAHNIKLIFVIFPLQNQVVNKHDVSCDKLSNFFKENGIYYIDLIKDFKYQISLGKILFKERDILHPNSEGHKVCANVIANYIENKNIIE
ncbi:MAG: SGNH/GDSL hydrolase family protein [Candidatus Omnitrophica bacterium]|nr:SGNH/GDSL hydrolase family protein [Candidatus Omnitrophota bacterium]